MEKSLFVAGMLLLPVVFFAVIEVGLRVFDFGDDYPLFVEVPAHAEYLQPNPDVGRRYFSRTSVVPAPPADAFRREKADGTYRIFIQGASTAAGFPYGHGGSFGRMLQQRLRQTFPDRSIEVINTSMAAVSSFTLADFTGEILAQQPDAVLIYAGHNEFYGALGAGSTESIGPTGTFVRWYLALDQLRVVQALNRLLTRVMAGKPTGRPPGATLMEELARERSIPLDSPTYRRGMAQFEANLLRLLCAYGRAGVPIFVGTLASNERDQPPFDGAPDDPALKQTLEGLIALEDTMAALASLDAALRADSTSADAFYARGRLLDAMGRDAAARRDFLAAKDRDRLRFRASEEANAVIRRVATACGARVVETQEALAQSSRDGIIGGEVMLEHLHPNVDGYFALSDAFYEALHGAGEIGEWRRLVPAAAARRAVLVTPLDTTLASLHVRRLRNNWPFQPPGVTRPDTIRVDGPIEKLALEVLQGRQTWLSATSAMGAYFEERGSFDEAFRAALALIQEEPYRDHPYLLAGNLLVKQERFAAAFQFFHEADERRPSAESRRMMGHALVRAGRPAEAVAHLRRALSMDDAHEGALYDLGVAFAETGRIQEARGTAERLLRLNPKSDGARRLLSRLPEDR